MKKFLILLGSSVITKEINDYAQSLGYHTIVADNLPKERSITKKYADEIWNIDLRNIDALEKKCREEKVIGAFCGVSEFALEVLIELCSRMGWPCYLTKESWHFSRDKADFKKVCKEIGAPVATDYYLTDALTDDELSKVKYPVVVKPVDLMGNVGISYCYNDEDLRKAYRLAKSLSHSDKIVVERMLHGKEWYSSYAIQDGEVRLLSVNAMIAQPGELANLYSLTTSITDNVPRFVREINPQIEAVLKAIGCKQGIAWVQVMLDEDDHFYIIEMGYRFPGDMTFIPYPLLINFDSVKWMVDLALGKKYPVEKLPQKQEKSFEKCGCGYSLWVKNGGVITKMDGLEEILEDSRITYYPTNRIGSHVDYHRTIGVFSFTTNTIDEFCEIINSINRTLVIENEKGEDMIIRYTDFNYLRDLYYAGLREE